MPLGTNSKLIFRLQIQVNQHRNRLLLTPLIIFLTKSEKRLKVYLDNFLEKPKYSITIHVPADKLNTIKFNQYYGKQHSKLVFF